MKLFDLYSNIKTLSKLEHPGHTLAEIKMPPPNAKSGPERIKELKIAIDDIINAISYSYWEAKYESDEELVEDLQQQYQIVKLVLASFEKGEYAECDYIMHESFQWEQCNEDIYEAYWEIFPEYNNKKLKFLEHPIYKLIESKHEQTFDEMWEDTDSANELKMKLLKLLKNVPNTIIGKIGLESLYDATRADPHYLQFLQQLISDTNNQIDLEETGFLAAFMRALIPAYYLEQEWEKEYLKKNLNILFRYSGIKIKHYNVLNGSRYKLHPISTLR